MKPKILVIDDEGAIRDSLRRSRDRLIRVRQQRRPLRIARDE